jgi:hypothetical protein
VIDELPLLTSTCTADLSDRVHRLRDHWVPRGPEPASFYTLGTPSYLDVAEDPATGYYEKHGVAARPMLQQHFGDLYEQVKAALSAHLDAVVQYAGHLALPGFHIWLEGAIFTRPEAPIHFDLQHQAFEWPPGADTSRQVSFTLPLRLPVAGGGLNLWDVTYDDFRRSRDRGWVEGASDLPRFYPKRYVAYRTGSLFVHSGHTLHQVAPSSRVEPGDERLTFQGHGVWSGSTWLLYW